MRMLSRRRTGAIAVAGALAMVLAACGGGSGSAGGGEENIVVGTTDTVNTLDPAKCYNYYCSNVMQNAGGTLVTYPSGSSQLTPQLAAEMPEISEDGTTYTFKLREGVTFTDGSKMTSEDVKFSLDRARWMNHPEGAGFLLEGIESIETPDKYTVVINLSAPDITFTSKLAYTVATVLPSDAYPSPSKPLKDGLPPEKYEEYVKEKFVGTGPYKIEEFREGQSITLSAYENYYGEPPKNDNVLVQFYGESAQMQAALQSGEIDVAFRALTPEQRKSLQGSDIKTIKGEGASIRYIVFNTKMEPTSNADVRRAVSAAIDRERIINEVLGGAGEPLYSMVPPVFEANEPSFEKQYANKKPSDFVNGKVDLTLWYSLGHYGDTEPALAQIIGRMLEESGSFNVTLKSAEWAQFSANAYPGKSGQYPAFLLGWYPDYLDPDDYVYPFYHSQRSFLQFYDNPKMDKLLNQEATAESPDSKARMQTFAQIQQLAAEDAPLVPLYVDIPYAHAQKHVQGVADTMGPAQIFRYSVISKSS